MLGEKKAGFIEHYWIIKVEYILVLMNNKKITLKS